MSKSAPPIRGAQGKLRRGDTALQSTTKKISRELTRMNTNFLGEWPNPEFAQEKEDSRAR